VRCSHSPRSTSGSVDPIDAILLPIGTDSASSGAGLSQHRQPNLPEGYLSHHPRPLAVSSSGSAAGTSGHCQSWLSLIGQHARLAVAFSVRFAWYRSHACVLNANVRKTRSPLVVLLRRGRTKHFLFVILKFIFNLLYRLIHSACALTAARTCSVEKRTYCAPLSKQR